MKNSIWECLEGDIVRLKPTFSQAKLWADTEEVFALLLIHELKWRFWIWEAEGLQIQRWQTVIFLSWRWDRLPLKKKIPKEVPDRWKPANKIQKLIFYSLQDSKAPLSQCAFSKQINTSERIKQRESKSHGKPRQVKSGSSQTLNKSWFSVDLNSYSSFNVNIS